MARRPHRHPLTDTASPVRLTPLLLLLLLGLLAGLPGGADGIRLVSAPVSAAGVLGRSARFACSVADKGEAEALIWRLQWDSLRAPQYVHLGSVERNQTRFVYDGLFEEKHATYTTRHFVNESVHTSILRLENIQAADEGSVVCMYQLSLGGSLVTRMIPGCLPVRFTVWRLPEPACSFRTTVGDGPGVAGDGDGSRGNATAHTAEEEGGGGGAPVVEQLDGELEPTVGTTVELNCADQAGVPAPRLAWGSQTARRGTRRAASNGTGPVVLKHRLRAEDNGRWFTCEATSEATELGDDDEEKEKEGDRAQSCRVRPMAVPPTARVTPTQLQLLEGAGNAEFDCQGRGLPEVVSYAWFIDGLPTHSVDHRIFPSIKISELGGGPGRGSRLTLGQILRLGRTEVACEVAVGAGFTGRAAGEVLLFPLDEPTPPAASPTPGRAEELRRQPHRQEALRLRMAPSAMAVIFSVVLFLLAVIAALLWTHRRRRRSVVRKGYRRCRYAHVFAVPAEPANGAPARHTKRFWAYMVTAV